MMAGLVRIRPMSRFCGRPGGVPLSLRLRVLRALKSGSNVGLQESSESGVAPRRLRRFGSAICSPDFRLTRRERGKGGSRPRNRDMSDGRRPHWVRGGPTDLRPPAERRHGRSRLVEGVPNTRLSVCGLSLCLPVDPPELIANSGTSRVGDLWVFVRTVALGWEAPACEPIE